MSAPASAPLNLDAIEAFLVSRGWMFSQYENRPTEWKDPQSGIGGYTWPFALEIQIKRDRTGASR